MRISGTIKVIKNITIAKKKITLPEIALNF